MHSMLSSSPYLHGLFTNICQCETALSQAVSSRLFYFAPDPSMSPTQANAAQANGHPVFGWQGLAALLALMAFALVIRSPNLLYTVLNWDESLYFMLGRDMNDGYVLYSHIWDRKPPGIFIFYAFFDMLPGHTMVWAHLFSNLAIGLGGWFTMRVAIRLTHGDRLTGWCAGLCYVAFSLSNGGLAANAEPFMMIFTVLGLWFLLAGFNLPHDPAKSRSIWLCFVGGLVIGVGLVVKTVLLFDILAFIILILLMSRGGERSYFADMPALIGHGLLTGLGIALPFALTFVWFWWHDHLDTYINATILSYNNLASEEFRFRIGNVLIPILDATPLWAGAVITALLWLTKSLRKHSVMLLAMYAWVTIIFIGIFFLRYYFDHYFLQLLPPLAILSGLVISKFVLGPGRSYLTMCLLPLFLVTATSIALTHNLFLHGIFTAKAQFTDDPFAGRMEDRAAHWLNERLDDGDQIFVFNDDPILYPLTRTEPPTQYPFPSYLTETGAYGLIEPSEEITSILDKEPRFIILRDDTLDPPIFATFPKDLVTLVMNRIESDYELATHLERTPHYEVHSLGRYYHSEGIYIYQRKTPS